MGLHRSLTRKAFGWLGAALVLLIVFHQLSFLDLHDVSARTASPAELIEDCIPETASDSAIPNIVHQTWRTTDVDSYSPDASRDSWRRALEPLNYTVQLWTDADVTQLLRAEYAWLLPAYEAYPQNIQRADVARLVVLHARGGIYADLDVHPQSPAALACLQRCGLEAIFAGTAGARGLSNHFFMARRGSPFLLAALREAHRRAAAPSRRILLPYLQVFWSTGPMMVTAVAHDYAGQKPAGPPALGLLSGAFAGAVMHHAAGRSWHGSDGRLFNYIGDHADMLRTALPVLVAAVGLVCLLTWRRGTRWPAVFLGKRAAL